MYLKDDNWKGGWSLDIHTTKSTLLPGGGFDNEYYDNIVGTMEVKTLNRTNSRADNYIITYNEVYPKTVSSVEFNHSTQNATLRVNVEMAYSYWTTNQL